MRVQGIAIAVVALLVAACAAEAAAASRSAVDEGEPTRVAILNFGAPGSWNGEIGDTVGIQVSARAWADAVPMLERDGVDVVVVRINSGGGVLAEVLDFFEVFQQQ